jgi:hypothetical protein
MTTVFDRGAWSPEALAARARRAAARADADLAGAIADFFLDDAVRLEERTRSALSETLRGIVGVVGTGLRRHAARLLAGRGLPELAENLLTSKTTAMARLLRAGVLRDPELMAELIARVRLELIAETLPVAITGPDEPSMLVRLAGAPDQTVARAAQALLAADNRRRSVWESGQPADTDLPYALHRRLVWWVAAAIREIGDEGTTMVVDEAIVEAATQTIATYADGERADAMAMRLALAIDPQPAELPDLLVEAIGDRRPAFFAALLAQALGMAHDQARALLLEPDGDRLWLALRAVGLDRRSIARIGLALSDADPTRDIEALADQLDAIVAVGADDARAALKPLSLDRDFRAAIAALSVSTGW